MSDDDATSTQPDPSQIPGSHDSCSGECERCGGVVLAAVRSLERRVRSLATQTAKLTRRQSSNVSLIALRAGLARRAGFLRRDGMHSADRAMLSQDVRLSLTC